jgi:hypothetical protein
MKNMFPGLIAAAILSLCLAGCGGDQVDKNFETLKGRLGQGFPMSIYEVESVLGPIPADKKGKMPEFFSVIFLKSYYLPEYMKPNQPEPSDQPRWVYLWSPPGSTSGKELVVDFRGDQAVGVGTFTTK